MKSLLLTISIFACLSVSTQTSVYHQFPDSNAVWNFQYQLNCFQNGMANESYSISISGDTLINSTSYHKLWIPYLMSLSTGSCGGYPIGYKGAIREDVQAKKVYIVPPMSNTEELLYDFNLQIGDTVKGYIESPISLEVIQSIDSILVGNSYRKRWLVNSCYNIYFIEGVGSTYGLLEPSPSCLTDLPDFSLLCFQENGRTLLPDTITACNLITFIQEAEIQANVSFYPNPFSNFSQIHVSQNLNNARLSITDLKGRLVKRIENISGDSYTFYAEDLTEGIYLARIEQDGKVLSTEKIVITE